MWRLPISSAHNILNNLDFNGRLFIKFIICTASSKTSLRVSGYLAEHQARHRGTLVCRGTPFGKHCNREIPTLDKISNVIKEDKILPNVGIKKLWQILLQLNFSWEKHNRKSILLDRQDIIFWRRQYLRDIAR